MPLRFGFLCSVASVIFISAGPALGTDATVDCHPKALDYETGSVTSSARTQFSLVHANGFDVDRGYMVFNTAAIPDGSTINSVQLRVFRYENDRPWWYITRLSSDPRSGDPAAVFADVGYTDPDGWYLYTEENTQPPGWCSYDLPVQAAADLQARLADDWFGVGFHETDLTGIHFVRFSGWFEPEKPYITVDYSLPAAEELCLAVNGHVNPLPQDDWVMPGTTFVELLWSRPEGVEIDSVAFSFSTDVMPWTPCWTDSDGGEELISSFWVSEDSGDGWTGYFDSDLISPSPTGNTPLHFRADVHTTGGSYQVLEDVTYDPTPPFFTIDVEDGQLFTDPTITVNVTPGNAGEVEDFFCNDVDTTGTVDKQVPSFCQFKPQYPRGGSTYCAPCAASACLRYFDNKQNPSVVPPGVSDDSLVEEMAGRIETDRDGSGSSVTRIKNGIRDYLTDHGQSNGYDIRGQRSTTSTPAKHWKRIKRAIELCYDVLPKIVWANGTSHCVTATGVRVCDSKT